MGLGVEEPNAIVQVGAGAATVPGLRATEVELYDGLAAATTRGWPCPEFDLLAINDFCAPLLGAGFYYKTFMSPRFLWRWYEHFLRRASGLGVSPQSPDPDSYEHVNAHCDVLVAGGGPAGLMAALAAAKCGARVIVADEQAEFGGSLLYDTARLNGNPAAEWLHKVLQELAQCPEVVLLSRSTVFGYYDHNFLTIMERCGDRPGEPGAEGVRQREWRVRARRVILAQGSHERPLVFPNNDRPGCDARFSSIGLYSPLRCMSGPARRDIHQQRRGIPGGPGPWYRQGRPSGRLLIAVQKARAPLPNLCASRGLRYSRAVSSPL